MAVIVEGPGEGACQGEACILFDIRVTGIGLMVREGFGPAIDGQATLAGEDTVIGVTGLCQGERAIQRAVAVSCEGPGGGIVAGDGQVLAIMGEGTADGAVVECQGPVARIGDSTIRFVNCSPPTRG